MKELKELNNFKEEALLQIRKVRRRRLARTAFPTWLGEQRAPSVAMSSRGRCMLYLLKDGPAPR